MSVFNASVLLLSRNTQQKKRKPSIQQRGQTTTRAQTNRHSKNEAKSKRYKNAVEKSNMSQGSHLKIPARNRREKIQEKQVGFDRYTRDSWSRKPCRGMEWDTSSDTCNQSKRVNEPFWIGTTLPDDTAPGQTETPQRPQESSQPTERKSTRGSVRNYILTAPFIRHGRVTLKMQLPGVVFTHPERRHPSQKRNLYNDSKALCFFGTLSLWGPSLTFGIEFSCSDPFARLFRTLDQFHSLILVFSINCLTLLGTISKSPQFELKTATQRANTTTFA